MEIDLTLILPNTFFSKVTNDIIFTKPRGIYKSGVYLRELLFNEMNYKKVNFRFHNLTLDPNTINLYSFVIVNNYGNLILKKNPNYYPRGMLDDNGIIINNIYHILYNNNLQCYNININTEDKFEQLIPNDYDNNLHITRNFNINLKLLKCDDSFLIFPNSINYHENSNLILYFKIEI